MWGGAGRLKHQRNGRTSKWFWFFLVVHLMLIPTFLIVSVVWYEVQILGIAVMFALVISAFITSCLSIHSISIREKSEKERSMEEIERLQTRISDLEEELAVVRQERVKEVLNAPNVVEIDDREVTPEPNIGAIKQEQILLNEELKAEKVAIEVLLGALEEAMAKGVISEDKYLIKQTKYKKELQQLDKKLKAPD